MTNQHLITPPPVLVEQWARQWTSPPHYGPNDLYQYIADQAAQWGGEQELEACCDWLLQDGYDETSAKLCAARRPKQPSLRKQALEALEHILRHSSTELGAETIRKALEALPND